MTSERPGLGLTWEEAGLGAPELEGARAAAASLAERLELAAQLAPFRPHAWPGAGAPSLPTLFLDDVSAIPFLVDIAGVEEYQHRARVRAGDGDLFAAVTPSTPGYEAYCRDHLRLGAPELLPAAPPPGAGPLEVARACAAGTAYDRLRARARAAGGLGIHPYMGIEAVFELAAKLARDADVPVPVLGPPPPVTWIANDKQLFSELVTGVLGPGWVVETRYASDPAGLADAVVDLGRRATRVGLKRTRCASGMGNVHWCRTTLVEPGEVEARVREFLARTEWDGREPVLAVAWEETDLSPSTQLWIPPAAAGPPALDGIYEQLLEGEQRVFLGSRPSGLPRELELSLARASLRVAAALQALGYVGRCSFDTLVIGERAGPFAVRFTECNGRWGGTSTPMHLVERVAGRPRPPYRAQDFVRPGLVGAAFSDVVARLGDALFDPASGRGTFVLYNVGPLASSGKLDVIALGRTQAEAEEALAEGLPRRLGV